MPWRSPRSPRSPSSSPVRPAFPPTATGGRRPTIAPCCRSSSGQRVDGWRAEWRGQHPPDPLRAPWARPGWYQRIADWVSGRLEELGRPPTGAIEQRRHWSISALLRTETATGRVWAKAVFPGFAHEPGVTAFLHEAAPGAVAPVLAVDDDEGWLLLDDIGAAVVAERPEADEDAIRRLVALQRTFLGRTDELAAAGFVPRPFSALPAQLTASLGDASLRRWLDLEPARVAAVVAWIEAAVGEVTDLGLEDTLVHGDFHPENVVVHDGRAVLFDWSDAAVAHPLVDAMTWSTWLDDDPARGERAWDVFLDAWSDVVPAERLRAARPTLVGLTAAYHTVSYVGILRAIEPALRDELGGGLEAYGHALDAAIPR